VLEVGVEADDELLHHRRDEGRPAREVVEDPTLADTGPLRSCLQSQPGNAIADYHVFGGFEDARPRISRSRHPITIPSRRYSDRPFRVAR
jgi:hypothetical protein